MAATAAMIADLRRMVAEPTTTTYSDALLQSFIETYPMLDSDGVAPDEDGWVAVYNLNLAAADVWTEKAAAVAANPDFTAWGSAFRQSQVHAQYLVMAKEYREKRIRSARGLPNDDSID
jgi:hypothetical protein